MFQFQNGAIKSGWCELLRVVNDEFQFQNGAIKRRQIKI